MLPTLGHRACGLLLQRLPGAVPSDTLAWQEASRRLDAFAAGALVEATAAIPLLQALFPEDDLRVFAAQPVQLPQPLPCLGICAWA